MKVSTHHNNGTRITKYTTDNYTVHVRTNNHVHTRSVTIASRQLKLSKKSFGKTPLIAFRGARKSINYEFFKRL